jgi:hypothetical protein
MAGDIAILGRTGSKREPKLPPPDLSVRAVITPVTEHDDEDPWNCTGCSA